MNKITKKRGLNLRAETVRTLSAQELRGVAGGLSGLRCSGGLTGCADCHDRPSLLFSNCDACATDICTF